MPKLAGYEVEGISVGGIETCIQLPRLKVAFDIGRCPEAAIRLRTILLTHSHMDHMGGVVIHAATRALYGMPPPIYVVPRRSLDAFGELFEVWRRLDNSDLPHEVVALEPGDEWTLPTGMVVRPFQSPHRIFCQGYSLWDRREKLLPELHGLPDEEIRRLRVEQGRKVTETVETPEIAFTGDTRVEVVENVEVVRKARLLIMETTFVDDRVSVERCRAKGHTHLAEVAERAERFENEAVLLTHFSARYTPEEVVAALDAGLPPDLRRRVTPLLEGLPRAREGTATA